MKIDIRSARPIPILTRTMAATAGAPRDAAGGLKQAPRIAVGARRFLWLLAT